MQANIQLIICSVVLAISISGCSGLTIISEDGTIHHLIIGIGVVSTPKNNGEYGVLASKVQALGIYFSNQVGLKFGAGYSSTNTVTIPDDAVNVIVELVQTPMGELSIEANPKVGGERYDNK